MPVLSLQSLCFEKGTLYTTTGMVSVYKQQKKWDQALDYFEQALSLNKQNGNSPGIVTCLHGIASVYQQQEKWEQALDYFEQALPYCEGNSMSMAACFQAIAFTYLQQGNLEQALDYYTRTLSLYEQMDNATILSSLLLNIGSIYQQQERWERAIEQYERAKGLYEQQGHGIENDLANLLWCLADCYRELGSREKSETYEAHAEQIREELQKPS